jgi:hypothetical protein
MPDDKEVIEFAEQIMGAANEMEDIYTKPAIRFVSGLRRQSLSLRQIMAFLLITATDGHLYQEDAYLHMDELALALDALSYCLQLGAEAVRDGAATAKLLAMREEGNA